ncbi:1,4-alpha-glucan branching enzyme [Modestobacter sp. DSM 44400]|uniref:alpha amylase C-terminal domain-containing protein n=1 Tax=Modestobacter sp. DSM 44400 TaxID=1550230 RepID=UPI00089A5758|nr:alpha-amylase family glycosyl hydrolase [Modestobacter sp. DSM 44400]SDY48002.1 1,4-alpha-glucan branching enzyme [Modestobacter sp. DSM 44400]
MAASQEHIDASTPMGATLVDGGATFRVWAPGARSVHVALGGVAGYTPTSADALLEDRASHHWTGFFPGVTDGTGYRFWVMGEGSGPKRDPWARELEFGDHLDTDCIVRDRQSYPWHDAAHVPPPFDDLVVYQLHIGVFAADDDTGRDVRAGRVATFLDALRRIEYLANLGVTAVQPLPVIEFRTPWSQGYNGTDLFSPEMDYCRPAAELGPDLAEVNRLLAARGHPPLAAVHLIGQVNQLKAFVDVCHVYGIAVLPDVVYNHAGGNLDDQSLDYFDRPAHQDESNSLYFGSGREAGGKVFDYAKPDVVEYLIGNARMFLEEYHVDGFRFDQVTVIDRNGGWSFCQDLTDTLRHVRPSAALIAEYWGEHRWKAVTPTRDDAGMGFDFGYSDGLRDAVRGTIGQASGGAGAHVSLRGLADGLARPAGFPDAWRAYNCVENHDLLLDADGDHRYPRVARLADSSDPRSWYARSRSRVATGVLLTAPGTPMLFMGQEFLADRWWSDDPHRADLLIRWADVMGGDRHAADFHLFTRDLIRLRRSMPALRSEGMNAYHVDEASRVVAWHRWVPGVGQDVVVLVSLAESTAPGYSLGLPRPGRWEEAFTSDRYDHHPNPWAQTNAGGFPADGGPMHGMAQSGRLTVPANSVVVLAAPDRIG